MEKLNYSLNKEPICFNCCKETDLVVKEGFYPQCSGCKDRPAVKKEYKHCLQNIDLCMFLICSINNDQNVNNGNTIPPSSR